MGPRVGLDLPKHPRNLKTLVIALVVRFKAYTIDFCSKCKRWTEKRPPEKVFLIMTR